MRPGGIQAAMFKSWKQTRGQKRNTITSQQYSAVCTRQMRKQDVNDVKHVKVPFVNILSCSNMLFLLQQGPGDLVKLAYCWRLSSAVKMKWKYTHSSHGVRSRATTNKQIPNLNYMTLHVSYPRSRARHLEWDSRVFGAHPLVQL